MKKWHAASAPILVVVFLLATLVGSAQLAGAAGPPISAGPLVTFTEW